MTRDQLIESCLPMAKAIAVKFWRCIPRRTCIELDDLIGIANLALVECVDRYKPEVAKLSTFAYLSLRGRILDYLGALPALTPVSLEDFFQDFACPGPAPGEELETAKRRHLMENAFDRLSPCQRQIMRMRYLDEMPIQEIGERLGVHRSNVSAHHSRAVKHLRHSREMKDLAA